MPFFYAPDLSSQLACTIAGNIAVKSGGAHCGERGVGIEKRGLMLVQFGPEDLEHQMRVRAVFDPAWLLNPAKVFPLERRDLPQEGGTHSC